ncbi:MAG: CcdB family protein [Saprospiraceae bacterium]|nr:CcdB family protein [Saprospiraceae bacterium]
MSKYDIHHWRKDESILLVIIQSDLFNEISTRLVIPLIEYRSAEKEGQEILKPNLIIREKTLCLNGD